MNNSDAAAAAAPGPRRRALKQARLVQGLFHLFELVLCQLLNPDRVKAGIEKAKQRPAVQALLAAHPGSDSAPPLRSAYNVFVQLLMQSRKSAGEAITLVQAAGVWSVLPQDIKEELCARYTKILLAEAAKDYEEVNGLEPIDYDDMWQEFNGVAAEAAAAKAAAAAVKGEGKHDHPAGSKPAATSVAGKNSSKRAAAEPLAELKDPKKPKTKHKKSKKKQKKNKDKNRKFKKGKVPQAPASPSY